MKIFAAAILLMGSVGAAKDLGFRFKDGKCVNEKGETGLNPSFIGQCGDLTRVTLIGLDFDGYDLSGSQYAESDLQGINLRNSTLIGCNFSGANLSGANLENAMAESANFQRTIFIKANLTGVRLNKSVLMAADFSDSLLSYTDFSGVNLANAKFDRATLEEANFSNSDLTNAQFSEAILNSAVLRKAILKGTNFQRADLSSANLEFATGEKPNFNSATLRNALLTGAALPIANFKNATLASANLTNANLQMADLRRATLKGATYTGISLKGAIYSKKTELPFSQADAEKMGMVLGKQSQILAWIAGADIDEEWANTLAAMKLAKPDMTDDDLVMLSDPTLSAKMDMVSEAEILLVPELERVDLAEFARLKDSLREFVVSGGIVIAMADALNFLNTTGLILSSRGNYLYNVDVTLTNPDHFLSKDIPPTFRAPDLIQGINVTADPEVEIALGDKASAYYLIKRMGKGMVVHVGHDFFKYDNTAILFLRNALNAGEYL